MYHVFETLFNILTFFSQLLNVFSICYSVVLILISGLGSEGKHPFYFYVPRFQEHCLIF